MTEDVSQVFRMGSIVLKSLESLLKLRVVSYSFHRSRRFYDLAESNDAEVGVNVSIRARLPRQNPLPLEVYRSSPRLQAAPEQ